jgi:hypothetical protein
MLLIGNFTNLVFLKIVIFSRINTFCLQATTPRATGLPRILGEKIGEYKDIFIWLLEILVEFA